MLRLLSRGRVRCSRPHVVTESAAATRSAFNSIRRAHCGPQLQFSAAAAATATSGDARTTLSAASVAAAAASLVALIGGTSIAISSCEAAESIKDDPPYQLEEQQQQQEEEEEDLYANLPEEDEATDCSMCNTFRQGPCRSTWRKLERCFKDNEGSDDGGVKCMRYFSPHQNCISGYLNLYQLIGLNMKQELVNDADKAVTPQERRLWKNVNENGAEEGGPVMDWTSWKKFYQEVGPSFQQTIPIPIDDKSESSSDSKQQIPLWKRLPPDTEPVLISTKATLPIHDKEKNFVLKIAYAIDQNGMVLGLGYNQHYMDLNEQATSEAANKPNKPQPPSEANKPQRQPPSEANKDDDTAKPTTTPTADDDKVETVTANEEDGTDKVEPVTTFDLEFYLLPGETKTVRICAMYSENPLTAAPEKVILDVLLYKTETSYDLERVATELNTYI